MSNYEHESEGIEIQETDNGRGAREPGCKCKNPISTEWRDFEDDEECVACARDWGTFRRF